MQGICSALRQDSSEYSSAPAPPQVVYQWLWFCVTLYSVKTCVRSKALIVVGTVLSLGGGLGVQIGLQPGLDDSGLDQF